MAWCHWKCQECQATTISTFLSLLGLNAMMTEGMWTRSERIEGSKEDNKLSQLYTTDSDHEKRKMT